MKRLVLYFLGAVVALISFSMGAATHEAIYGEEKTAWSDVKPIFKQRCNMCHHSGFKGSDWNKYRDVFNKREKIKFRLQNRTMPPGNATRMTDEERTKILDWIDQGAKK